MRLRIGVILFGMIEVVAAGPLFADYKAYDLYTDQSLAPDSFSYILSQPSQSAAGGQIAA